jgi:hypothetical protein
MSGHLEVSLLQASGFGLRASGRASPEATSLKPALEVLIEGNLLHDLAQLVAGLGLLFSQIRDLFCQRAEAIFLRIELVGIALE